MSVPTLYFYALESDEEDLLRDVVKLALAEKGPHAKDRLLVQNDFLAARIDIRSFLRGDKTGEHKYASRTKIIEKLYNSIMGPVLSNLRHAAKDNVLTDERREILQKIEELWEIGIKTERYNRDITVYMDKIVSSDIEKVNVSSGDRGCYVGYRYSMNKEFVVRFFVQIFYDRLIERTRFQATVRLPSQLRETKGFAYAAAGHNYLSGFINGGIGYETITFRNVANEAMRAGLVLTTSANGIPAAKQCVLVRPERIVRLTAGESSVDSAGESEEVRRAAQLKACINNASDTELSEDKWVEIGMLMTKASNERWTDDIDDDLNRNVSLREFVDVQNVVRIGEKSHATERV